MRFLPSYRKISSEEFNQRLSRTNQIIKKCTSCPRNCFVDRTNGELGSCQSEDKSIVLFTHCILVKNLFYPVRMAPEIFFGNCKLRCGWGFKLYKDVTDIYFPDFEKDRRDPINNKKY